VILPKGWCPDGLNDSKKLTAKKRDKLFDEITENAVAYGIGTADEREIDELNILNATYLAMNRAMAAMNADFDLAMIDGNRSSGIEYPSRTYIGGDGKSASIAAASILAKVSRDRFMMEMAEKYPEYHFESHKGYGTKKHYDAIREFGPSPIHRLTFLKKLH
jgi:ribonuclease HII